jgi:hypothetical protein
MEADERRADDSTRRSGAATTGQPIDALFTRLALIDITPFVVITAQDRSGEQERAIVLVDLVGDPAGRLDQILAQQVDTAETPNRRPPTVSVHRAVPSPAACGATTT